MLKVSLAMTGLLAYRIRAFGRDTTTPITFVSDTYDPVAPIEKYASSTHERSAFHSLTDYDHPQWAFLRLKIQVRAASYH